MAGRYIRPSYQYFDNSGRVLDSGQLFFYDSGTTTLKEVYSDPDGLIPIDNPVVLDGAGRTPNVYLEGSYKLIIQDKNDVQIEERDPVLAADDTTKGFADWNAVTTYSVDDIVRASNGLLYIAIVGSNQNNEPSASAAEWTQVQLLSSYNANETYIIGDVVIDSIGDIYRSLTNANTGNTPSSSPSDWSNTVSGAFGTENILTTGTLGAGKTTVTDGNNTLLLEGRTDGGSLAGTGASNISVIDGIYASNPIPGARIAFAHQGSGGQRGGLTFASKNVDDDATQPTVNGVLTPAGNWGFGTTNPAYKAEVAGTLGVTGVGSIGGAAEGYSGGLEVHGAAGRLLTVDDGGGASRKGLNLDVNLSSSGYVAIDCYDYGGSVGYPLNLQANGGPLTVGGTATFSDNVVIGTSGKGIDFSANTGSGSETSELLDWYEEGTWTPDLRFGAGLTGMSYTSRNGRYTRIGRQVMFEGDLLLSAKGSSTGTATVQGLPFTAAATINPPGTVYAVSVTTADTPLLEIGNSSALFTFVEISNAGTPSSITDADFSNTSNPRFSGQYNV